MRTVTLVGLLLGGSALAAEPITASQPSETSVWSINTSILASAELPPGTYAVTASLDAVNKSDKESAIKCAIADGGMLGVDKSFAEGTLSLGTGSVGKLSIEAEITVPANDEDFWVYFDCQGAEGTTTPLTVSNGVLTATPK